MKLTRRLEAAIIVAVVLAVLVVGGLVHDWQHSQEVAAARNAPPLTDEEVLAANALNERAMREDHLPTGW